MNFRFAKSIATNLCCKNSTSRSLMKSHENVKCLLSKSRSSAHHSYSTVASSGNIRRVSSSLFVNSAPSLLFRDCAFPSFSTQTKANNFQNNQVGVSAESNDCSMRGNNKVETADNAGDTSAASESSEDSSGNANSKASSNEENKKKRKKKDEKEDEKKDDEQQQQQDEIVVDSKTRHAKEAVEQQNDNVEELLIKLREENKIQKNKIKELQQKLLDLLTDLDISRERHIKELENARVYSITNFAKTMIEVADSLSLAMNTLEKENSNSNDQIRSILDGVKLTEDNFLSALSKFEITRYNPLNELFNPAYHEALFEINDPTKEKGVVAQVIQTGYKIQDRILRAAKVGVAK